MDQVSIEEFTPSLAEKLKGLSLDGGSSMSRWLADPESDYAPSYTAIVGGQNPMGWAAVGSSRQRRTRGMPVLGVFVSPKLRGSGIGSRLVKAVLADLDAEPGEEILIDGSSWKKLESLVRDAGFVPLAMEEEVDDFGIPLSEE